MKTRLEKFAANIQAASTSAFVNDNSSNKLGVDAIAKVLESTIEVYTEVKDALADKKLGYIDVVKIGLEIKEQFPTVLDNWEKAVEEIKELSPEDLQQLWAKLTPSILSTFGVDKQEHFNSLINGLLKIFSGVMQLVSISG
jgi:septation ring formation regulator EzrA